MADAPNPFGTRQYGPIRVTQWEPEVEDRHVICGHIALSALPARGQRSLERAAMPTFILDWP